MSTIRSFGINGRYLTQPMTGVQRYALNVTRAISENLLLKDVTVPLLVPVDTPDPQFKGTPLRTIEQSTGHYWEQTVLPRKWNEPLLNLCNTAPIIKNNNVICIHDANVFVSPESYSFRFRALYKTLQPLLARRAVQITTVSNFSARQIAHHLSIKVSDIIIMPNGHEHVHDWDPGQAIIAPSKLKKYQDDLGRPFVLALGSRARHKNIKLLINMAAELSEIGVDLIFAGGQADIFADENLIVSSNVIHMGFISDNDLAYLLSRALCLAFPSLTEGFGLPVLEAMARGCPVISTDRASLPEICGNAALLASPEQPENWMGHIRSLLASDNLRAELIGRGYAQAKLFSWSNTAQGYLDIMHPGISKNSRHDNMQIITKLNKSIVVVIATIGRPTVFMQTLRRIIDNQSYKPAAIIVSCVKIEDVGEAVDWPGVTVIMGKPGLAAQRNLAISVLPKNTDIVAFFDDDFIPQSNWLDIAAKVFSNEADIVGFTGNVLVDGIKGPGLSFEEVDRILFDKTLSKLSPLIEPFSPYGCNMAFRLSAIGTLRFDERLVLYGWLEDRDFGAALAAKGGRLVKCMSACGVHMGVKSGRIPGDRLGYSQIVNPIYLLRKGTMTKLQVLDHLFRNLSSNVLRFLRPESFIDRRGRLKGNLYGIADVLLGRIEPERALKVKNVIK